MTQLRITPLNRPIDNQEWRHRSFTPEELAANAVYCKQQEALRAQFESEWVPPLGYSRERDLEEMENIQCAAFAAWQERRTGRIVAVSTPVWTDAFEYWLIDGPQMENDGILAREPTAVALTLPVVLKGGGDMAITFETQKYTDRSEPGLQTQFVRKHRLVVRTEHGVFTGWLTREYGERQWCVVSLPPTGASSASPALSSWAGTTPLPTPQEVADRVANTLDAINELNLRDDYLAIMPVSNRCSICARPLTDIVSKTLGIGPDCAQKLQIAHSVSVADAIISKRRAFLGGGKPLPSMLD